MTINLTDQQVNDWMKYFQSMDTLLRGMTGEIQQLETKVDALEGAVNAFSSERKETQEETPSSPLTPNIKEEEKEERKPTTTTQHAPEKKVRKLRSYEQMLDTVMPPTRELVQDYMDSYTGAYILGDHAHLRFTAQQFIDYYETRGWLMKKGVMMKSWTSALRMWVKNDDNF